MKKLALIRSLSIVILFVMGAVASGQVLSSAPDDVPPGADA